LLTRRLMAQVMARARSASCKRNHGRSKCPPARAFAVERVTRIELAWPAWKTKPERLWLGGFAYMQKKRLTLNSRE
jgi:hypothetical protein